MTQTSERPNATGEHAWTLPTTLATFFRITEQAPTAHRVTGEPMEACLWWRDMVTGSTVPVSIEDAGWLGQALLDFATAAREARPVAACTDCGRPMREVRHLNGRCADCY